MKQYKCSICGYIYEETQGALWTDLPDDWVCPLCQADKSAFEVVEDQVMTAEEPEAQGNDSERLTEN